MRAGLLNEIIDILTPDEVSDGLGEIRRVYRKAKTIRARVQTPGSSRSLDNSEVFYGVSALFTVRRYQSIHVSDLIEWQGNRYRVTGIDHDREKQEQRIKTELVNE